MSLIATLLAGSCAVAPTRAVGSVLDWVDHVLVLDSGLSAEHLAAIQTQAGEKFRHVRFPWPHDFATARNFALDQATHLGGRWAVTIDTDEQLHFPGYAKREELLVSLDSNPDVQSWLVPFRGGHYAKERFIRLPAKFPWQGKVHEQLSGIRENERVFLPGAYFEEEGKTQDQMSAKLTRDRQVLEDQIAGDPRNARAWFYLAKTLEALKESGGAIAAYLQCAELSNWPDEAAWALYKAASGMFHTRQFDRGLHVCTVGRARKPLPELAWLAGRCALELGEAAAAVEWARQAIADAGDPASAVNGQNAYFKFAPAWFEAPHDLMRDAFHRLGMPKGAQLATEAFRAAKARRLKLGADLYPVPFGAPKRTLFDLGVHYGEGMKRLVTELALDHSWEIQAFEPNPACRTEERLSDLMLPIRLQQAAAWTQDGHAEFIQENPHLSDSQSPNDHRSEADGWASCLACVREPEMGLESRITVPTVDFARVLGDCDSSAEITVKMDIEGAEFAILRHLITTGTITRIRRLYIEWHERFAIGESPASRDSLQREIEKAGVEVVDWG